MGERDEEEDARIDREAILARRRRFVVATLTGLTTSTLATACPCLKMAAPAEPDAAGPADAEAAEEHQDDGDSVEEASPADGEIPEADEVAPEDEGG
ncbi:MAG: hypothetical protein H6712_30590 [Myxococcales bacterium]|nr:hypothetical protein [Myxococcales bacterium]MCB9718238.1 hypothetical protein [Myxococcales bacterium]